jgi:hypothetical protein
MGRDDDPPRDRPDQLDVVEVGGSRDRGRQKYPWLWWLPLVLTAGVVVGVVAHPEPGRSPSVSSTPPQAPTAARSSSSGESTAGGLTSPMPLVTELGRPLLGVADGWELFGRASTEVVRIEFARGRVTRTAVPALASTGPVSFVVGPDSAIVRPLDFVPGYVVPDGQPAHAMTGTLSLGGPALPGPKPGTVWVPAEGDGDHPAMVLVGADGRSTRVSIPILPGMSGDVGADGAGYLLLNGTGGVYNARPDGVRRITSGALLAVGPTRWLALECDVRYRCATVVIDHGTGARRVIDSTVDQARGSPGAISPDGTTAALHEADPDGATFVHLIDLVSGVDRRLDVPIDQSFNSAPLAWSPDSRWLFIAGAGGRLFPVDIAAAQVRDLGLALPPIYDLVVRNTPIVPT